MLYFAQSLKDTINDWPPTKYIVLGFMLVVSSLMLRAGLHAIKAQKIRSKGLTFEGKSAVAIGQLWIIISIGGILVIVGSIIYHLTR